MRKTAWISLWGTTLVAGFAIGIAVGKAHKPEVQPRRPATATTHTEKNREEARLLASLEQFRDAFTEKEQIAAGLRAEIEEVRGKVLPPLSAEDEKWLRERQEEDKHTQRFKTCWKRSEELVKKVLQRRDKVLREEGLAELESLLKNSVAEDNLAGLWALGTIVFDNDRLDKGRFKPLAQAALFDDDPQVRETALRYLGNEGWRGDKQGAAETALTMVSDPDVSVKTTALRILVEFGGRERNEDVAAALKSLLREENSEITSIALQAMRDLSQESLYASVAEGGLPARVAEKAYDYYEEMRHEVIEASRNAEAQEKVLTFWWGRQTLDKDELERAAEILNAMHPDQYYRVAYESNPASPELRQHAYSHYFRVIRESLDPPKRWMALSRLVSMDDKSLILVAQHVSAAIFRLTFDLGDV